MTILLNTMHIGPASSYAAPQKYKSTSTALSTLKTSRAFKNTYITLNCSMYVKQVKKRHYLRKQSSQFKELVKR